jgi:serine/threonine-protein kinase
VDEVTAAEAGRPALAKGNRVGPYEIVAPLGAGGMGEVYRARDTKLKRDVALKVLPEAFAKDPGRMLRFQREAEVLASLNHPNIAHIYGVEERALVMELVEGESPRGPLPFDDTWKIVLQIAEALEYAHEKGVIHRDLKPANVKVTPDGVVKLLDFGLAKAFSETPDAGGADPENSPTVTLGATVAGTVLGTAAYMSPEQAKGKKIDKRADIWSWGVVLYELLTGERLFKGGDMADTLAQVLTKQPPLERTPPQVHKLLRRCLEKDPRGRLRDIGDARDLLDEPVASASSASPGLHLGSAGWIAAGVLGLAVAGLVLVHFRNAPAPERPLVSLSAEMARGVTLMPIGVAVSPDGKMMAAVVRGADGQARLATRRLDQNQITILADTEGASGPYFSPDGQWIAFSSGGMLKRISSQGGAPVLLYNGNVLGGSWGGDGTIVAPLNVGSGLSRIPEAGGTPVPITQLDPRRQERAHRWPQILPGGQTVLFTIYDTIRDYDDSEIDVVSLKTGERKMVYRGGTYARYLPSGHLVFVHQDTLFAAAFDLQRLTIVGAPQPIVENIRSGPDLPTEFGFAPNGTFVYLTNEGELKRSLFWLDSAGHSQPLQPTPGLYGQPRFSPDGRRLAFSLDDGQGHTDIWVRNLERDTTQRLTSLAGRNDTPVWTPDASGIVFHASNPAAPGIYWMRSDGSGEPQRLTDLTNPNAPLNGPAAISADGKWLAGFRAATAPGTGGAIWMVPIEGEADHPKLGKATLFLNSALYPAFSPDGRWVAYFWQVSGRRGVWVRPLRGPGGPWLVDSDGLIPVWPRKGHELFYVSRSSGRLMAAGYAASGDSFVPEKPRVWSEKALLPVLPPIATSYDVTPDGKRFVVVLYEDGTAEERPITHVTFLLNFFDELRRKVPVE